MSDERKTEIASNQNDKKVNNNNKTGDAKAAVSTGDDSNACVVIFTYDKLPYRELEAKNRSEYYSKKYKIGFYSSDIQQKFFELLDHPCPKCNCPPYRTFQGLRNHVRKEHDLYYCDLCVEHLKIFTFERR
ncbi:hypothetical protein DOY81_010069, partial [Sarcophaga bullata]